MFYVVIWGNWVFNSKPSQCCIIGQRSAVGLSDYRWGPNGGDNNENFSYFTLDYGRVTSAIERVLEEHLVPVTMVGTYTVQYNVIPGE